mmetsp:Transcript_26114/g.83374  ORF Transcript_26114/g.83374 Transcript_26114/m.83374 type:complete len:522 (+) Transcript_26114:2492-4057(+)
MMTYQHFGGEHRTVLAHLLAAMSWTARGTKERVWAGSPQREVFVKPAGDSTLQKYQWDRRGSKVTLRDPNHAEIDVSEHVDRYRELPQGYKAPRVIKRGDVDKYTSDVPIKEAVGPAPSEVYKSQSKLSLPPPGVVYDKVLLPDRYKSTVPLFKGKKGSYHTAHQDQFTKYKTPAPPVQCRGDRGKSTVDLSGSSEVKAPYVSVNAGTYRRHMPRNKTLSPNSRRLALLESDETPLWDGAGTEVPSLRASPLSSHRTPRGSTAMSPRGSPTTVLPHQGYEERPIIRGSINKCFSTIDLTEGPRPHGTAVPAPGEYFVSSHSTQFLTPAQYEAHREFHRTRSTWVPGIDPLSYATTNSNQFTGGKEGNKDTRRFQWKRTKSNVTIVPPPGSSGGPEWESGEYREAYKLGLADMPGFKPPVMRGQVNKYTSQLEIPHSKVAKGDTHRLEGRTTQKESYNADGHGTPRGGARFFDRTASTVPMAHSRKGRKLASETTYKKTFGSPRGVDARREPLKTECTVRLL